MCILHVYLEHYNIIARNQIIVIKVRNFFNIEALNDAILAIVKTKCLY